MRTFSTQAQHVFESGAATTRLRVSVKDAGGTFRDLTSYPEADFVLGAEVREGNDDNGMACSVTLQRAIGDRSLAPLHETSPLNLAYGSSSFSALVGLGRELKLEAGVCPDGDSSPVEWMELFRGYIDAVDWPGETLEIDCVGLEGLLRDTWIETERVYAYAQGAHATKGCRPFELGTAYVLGELIIPSQAKLNGHFYRVTTAGTTSTSVEPTWPTGGASTVTSGTVIFTESGSTSTSVGTNVETVIQQILDDSLGAGVVSLRTPTSPAWAIRYFLQARGSLLDAVRALAEQIGWFVRFAWSSGDSAFRLTLFEPGRAKSAADYAFTESSIRAVEQCRVEATSIRNFVRVIYPDSAALDAKGMPPRKAMEVSDSSSIAKYGRRFMEISEGSASNIDTSAEASALANAALSDLKEPEAEFSAKLGFFPWVQLGDMLEFPANGRQFTTSQILAVVSWQHSFSGGTASTRIETRGKPATGLSRWLEREARGSGQETHQLNMALTGALPTFDVDSNAVGGAAFGVYADVASGQYRPVEFELHVSKSSGFVPTDSTLRSAAGGNSLGTYPLEPGETYFAKFVPFGWNGEKHVRGLPSDEVSFVAGRAKAGHYDSTCTQGHLPLNGNFEHATRDLATKPPDHWEVASGESWGSSGSVWHGTDSLKGRYVALRAHATLQGKLVSSAFEVRRGVRAFNLSFSARRVSGTGSITVEVAGYSDAALTTWVFGLSQTYADTNFPSAGAWYEKDWKVGAIPANANFLVVKVYRAAAGASDAYDVGDIYTQEADYAHVVCDGITAGGLLVSGDTTLAQTAWAAPALASGWGNFGSGYDTAGYFRDSAGVVHLRGLVVRTSGTGLTMLTLPVGFRPAGRKIFAGSSADAYARIDITTAGDVILSSGSPTTWVSLEGITFDTR